MNLRRALRTLWAFFRRDLAIARSYRLLFLLEPIEMLFAVATFFYLSRFVQSTELTRALPRGMNYFTFALVGLAFFDYLNVAFSAFEQSLDQARRNGTLEALLVTETPLPVMLVGSALYPFTLTALRTAVYLGWGMFVFGFPWRAANWPGALAVLLVSILAFAGLGVLSASYLLVFKRGNPARWLFIGASGLLGGMMYPVSVLPRTLQFAGRLVPITYSLEGMRGALLQGASFGELWPSLRALLLFAVVFLPVSFAAFAWALRRTKVTGTLTHF